MPKNGMPLNLPLPDGMLYVRSDKPDAVPIVVTSTHEACLSHNNKMLWRSLSDNGASFIPTPSPFIEPDRLSRKHSAEFFSDESVRFGCRSSKGISDNVSIKMIIRQKN